MKRTIILSVFIGIILSGCSKESPDPIVPPTPDPDIKISLIYPANEAKIPFQADTGLKVLITDKLSLHEYTVRISDSQDSTVYYTEGHTHTAEFYFVDSWVNTAAPGEILNLTIRASNHKGDILERKFKFFSEL
ncbi:MAG TPA: hypothetical protein DIW47_13980 [Bacteroidetes bacterium]|nr:hypothetical protein [Bacteroidota bacterium]